MKRCEKNWKLCVLAFSRLLLNDRQTSQIIKFKFACNAHHICRKNTLRFATSSVPIWIMQHIWRISVVSKLNLAFCRYLPFPVDFKLLILLHTNQKVFMVHWNLELLSPKVCQHPSLLFKIIIYDIFLVVCLERPWE